MKTLYISDLDGTLLNKNAELSDFTARHLKGLIEGGINISVATARTAATCDRILGKVPFKIPIILMNGVLIYDFSEKKYVNKEVLTRVQVRTIISAMKDCNVDGFMYGLENGRLITFYERLSNAEMEAFYSERTNKYGKEFMHAPNLGDCLPDDFLYFCFMDTSENIHRLYDKVKNIDKIRIEKYKDIYSSGDLWYMEVFSDRASKYNALMYLREKYGFEQVVAFGDNLNDIPLFKASDICFAVANANDEVKAAASAVIGANTDDSVVKQIELMEDKQ